VAEQQEVENALERIGFGQQERDAFIQASRCINIAMISLLTLLELRFWVVGK
jgi:hypothetical protein